MRKIIINQTELDLKQLTVPELLKLKEAAQDEIMNRKPTSNNSKRLISYTDGASRGNPGHSGIGVIIFDELGEVVLEECAYIGQTTNNEAEYQALLLALEKAAKLTSGILECNLDSELVVRQLNGQYKVKSERMASYFSEVKKRMAHFSTVTFSHVPREHPRQRLADKLANKGIDQKDR